MNFKFKQQGFCCVLGAILKSVLWASLFGCSLANALDLNSSIQVAAPKIVFVTTGADGEFSSAGDAFSAASARYNWQTVIAGQTYSRSISNLHVFRPDYYQSYNGVPSYYSSDSTACAAGECTFTADGGPQVMASGPRCPEDVIKRGNAEYGFVLTDTTADPNSKAREFKCIRTIPKDEPPQDCKALGDPIHPSTGEQIQAETDYSSADGVLKFIRTYRSSTGMLSSIATSSLIASEAKITFPVCHASWYTENTPERNKIPYCFYYQNISPEYYVLISPDGRSTEFMNVGGVITSKADVNERLAKGLNAQGQTEWVVTHSNNAKDTYDVSGKLIRSVSAVNQTILYTYSDVNTPSTIAPRPNMLLSMADQSGRQLQFIYNASAQMVKMIDPSGGIYQYAYDNYNNLISVTYPDSHIKKYFYNEAANINNGVACSGDTTHFKKKMTGFTDENSVRFADIKYQCDGKAISAEHVGGIEKFSFNYLTTSTTRVTDPLGSNRDYTSTKILGVNQQTSISQPGGSGCSASSNAIGYDANGNVSNEDDFNGLRRCYSYDTARNLPTVLVEGLTNTTSCSSVVASGALLPTGARKISTEWSSTMRKSTRVAEPKKITTYVYNGQPDPFNGGSLASCAPAGVSAALLCKKVEQATTDANGSQGLSATLDTNFGKREWRYTYNSFGKVLTAIAPQNIVTNTVGATYEYYSSDSSSWKTGDLKKITNALGQVIQYQAYDAHGHLIDVILADGSRMQFSYDVRGRLISSRQNMDVTTLTYNVAGKLNTVTSPTGTVITYTYDAAQRLTAVSDNLGNRMEYTFDNASNITGTVMRDSGGSLRYQQQKIYDALSRVKQVVDTQNHQTTYLYDANGNNTGVTDPKLQNTSNAFDALNQLKLTTDALNGKTEITRDAQGQVTAVKDPRGNSTNYAYNPFGELVQLISPDTGITTFTYDAAGNRISATDARGIVVNYTYDALNRLTSVKYPASAAENILYTYDDTANGNYGVGRLTGISGNASTMSFTFDSKGLLTKKYVQTANALSTIQYAYDTAGNLTGITYPSGRTVTYTRDTVGRIQAISTKATANASVQNLLSSINYLPFGPASSFAFGNGLSHSNTYDTDYRLTAIQVGGVLSRGYSYDANDNITGINNVLASTKSQTFGYDPLNRLTTAAGVYGNLGYTYDAVGNRLTEVATLSGATTTNTYSYATTSNRLNSIAKTGASTGTRNFTYDAAGNRTQGTSEAGTTQTFTYNNADRLASAATATYQYNPLGQRVSKAISGVVQELYFYDESGQLIAVTNATGVTQREYIYNGNQLVSFVNVTNTTPIASIPLAAASATFVGSHTLSKAQTGYTGSSGYIDYVGEGQVNWSLPVVTSATYNVNVRYSLGGVPNRPLTLLIDGVSKGTVNFTTTANWNTWNVATVSVALTAGNHTLSLKTTGSSGPNVDKVDVVPAAGQGAPSTSVYYVHNDHLNTPQVVTDQNKNVVWMADYQPFGKVQLGQSNSIELYSRFPGQYVDNETGLYYNYFRDYDPSIGRYIESDPIGLNGGVNTYAYVGGNPLRGVDPRGLEAPTISTMGLPNNQGNLRLPDYVQFQLDAYVYSTSATYTSYGDVFWGKGFSRPYPSPLSGGVSISAGWFTPKGGVCSSDPRKDLNDFLAGWGAGGGGYFYAGGSMSANGSGTAVNFGVGFGGISMSPGIINSYQGNFFGNN